MKPLSAALVAMTILAVSHGESWAQDAADATSMGSISQVSTHMGEMSMSADAPAGMAEITDTLRFEPYQLIEEMFFRDDVVFLMRHGPTDWSRLDVKNVVPDDCASQRVMVEEGERAMRDLGTLMAANDIVPSRIVSSEWCRNRQTVDALVEGFARVDPALADAMPVEIDPSLNLLLSLQGAEDTVGLEERISEWEGDPDRSGPLLIVSHYTNIEELTQFRVFEGEILVLDPKRDNKVLGYLRLRSAAPDVGHFADALSSPLLERAQALDMVSRYYEALNANDLELLQSVVAEDWVTRGGSPSMPDQNADGFIEYLSSLSEGLSDVRYEVEDVFLAEDVITVRGTISGRHTGTLYDLPATGREVVFGTIGVHRVENGTIVESWQMADRATLQRLISN